MKNSVLAFSVASVLLTSLFIVGTLKTGVVAALTATTTEATATDAEPAIILADTASSTPVSDAPSTDAAALAASTTTVHSTDNATSTASDSATSSVSGAKGKPALKRVHVVGSKYIDFFTDGTTIFSFPGDSLLDANLDKPDAPIPTHAGLTWVSSKAMEAYDTASSDLESGTYAQEVNGSFITNLSDTSASATSTTPVAFSLLDPTLDSGAAPPAPKTEAFVPPAPAHAAVADRSAASTTSPLPNTAATASSTPDGSTTASASSTAAAAMASSTPVVVSATSTATSTAASSSVASSSFASANDNAASTTATQ